MTATTRAERTMIRLEGLSKSYPGQPSAAVEHLDLEIPAGRIVVFVGPSGCGKTTTMKLINRLIEPTSGRIHLDGTDVTEVNPDELRRTIGYSIQQTGLFPHRTVGDNIATMPKMLGWGTERVRARRRAARTGRPGPGPLPRPLSPAALRRAAAARRCRTGPRR